MSKTFVSFFHSVVAISEGAAHQNLQMRTMYTRSLFVAGVGSVVIAILRWEPTKTSSVRYKIVIWELILLLRICCVRMQTDQHLQICEHLIAVYLTVVQALTTEVLMQ